MSVKINISSFLNVRMLCFSFILGFILAGCGGEGSLCNSFAALITHSVNFYDENLDFIEIVQTKAGSINPSDIRNGSWYRAGENLPVINHNLNGDISFYAVPNVTVVTAQKQLAAINMDNAALSGKYILMNDVELDENEDGFDANNGWKPIGNLSAPFSGVFNGNFHKITNLWINGHNHTGFFGFAKNAQIRNIGIETAKGIKGNFFVGGIVGAAANSTVINGHVMANISANMAVGGIAGSIKDSVIANSYSAGNIKSGSNGVVGGIAGLVNDSSVTNSYSAGNINGSSTNSGGIVGSVYDAFITENYFVGNIRGSDNVGGIAGCVESYFISSTIQNNAAVNPSVEGAYGKNRIIGNISGGAAISNNFALESMAGNFSSQIPENYGENKTMNELKMKAVYETDLGWKFGGDKDNPWKWDANKNNALPYLYWQKL